MHSVDKALESRLFKSIIIVSNVPLKNIRNRSIKIIKGGKERYQSSQNAINFLKNKKIKNVFIHDAARPNFSIKLLKRLYSNLKNNKAVVPFLKTEDSSKYKVRNNDAVNFKKEFYFESKSKIDILCFLKIQKLLLSKLDLLYWLITNKILEENGYQVLRKICKN